MSLRNYLTLISFLFLSMLLISVAGAADKQDNSDGPWPSIDYAPADVVKIVVDALRDNTPDDGDQGIEIVFRFASPENKEVTGPLDRFTGMIKRGFPDMLNHTDSEMGEIEIVDDKALQLVWLTTPAGDEVGYLFQMGKQPNGMWMTDAVYPQPDRGQSI